MELGVHDWEWVDVTLMRAVQTSVCADISFWQDEEHKALWMRKDCGKVMSSAGRPAASAELLLLFFFFFFEWKESKVNKIIIIYVPQDRFLLYRHKHTNTVSSYMELISSNHHFKLTSLQKHLPSCRGLAPRYTRDSGVDVVGNLVMIVKKSIKFRCLCQTEGRLRYWRCLNDMHRSFNHTG